MDATHFWRFGSDEFCKFVKISPFLVNASGNVGIVIDCFVVIAVRVGQVGGLAWRQSLIGHAARLEVCTQLLLTFDQDARLNLKSQITVVESQKIRKKLQKSSLIHSFLFFFCLKLSKNNKNKN